MKKRPAFAGSVRKNAISILGLLIATPVLLYSLSVATPSQYASSAKAMLAGAASMSASVAENPYNTLAAALAKKEAELNDREAQLALLKAKADAQGPTAGEIFGVSSFFISLLLLLLVVLNFYYDMKRNRNQPILPRKFFVDLR